MADKIVMLVVNHNGVKWLAGLPSPTDPRLVVARMFHLPDGQVIVYCVGKKTKKNDEGVEVPVLDAAGNPVPIFVRESLGAFGIARVATALAPEDFKEEIDQMPGQVEDLWDEYLNGSFEDPDAGGEPQVRMQYPQHAPQQPQSHGGTVLPFPNGGGGALPPGVSPVAAADNPFAPPAGPAPDGPPQS